MPQRSSNVTGADIVALDDVSLSHITIDPKRFLVLKNGIKINLTRTEFLILYLMISTNGLIHSAAEIERFVWGMQSPGKKGSIRTHISNIRKKIGPVNGRGIITAVRGIGYKFEDSNLQ